MKERIISIDNLKGLKKFSEWRGIWSDKDSVDISWYISMNIHPEDALLFCRILFPNFIIKDGAIILEDRFDDNNFDSWFKTLNGNISSVEEILNHVHLYDVFGGCTDKVDDIIYVQLAELIAKVWRMLLMERFPERRFSVVVSNTQQDYGPIVTFFQKL